MLNEGAVLAHWYYEPGEWEYFVDSMRAAAMRRIRIQFGQLAAIYFLIILLVAWIFAPSGWLTTIIALVGLGVPIAAVFAALFFWGYNKEVRWREQLRTLPPQVFITRDHVVFGGPEYVGTSMSKATKRPAVGLWVRVDTRKEPALCFTLTHYLRQSYREEIRVLIPKGRNKEAQRIVAHFRS